MIILRAFLVGCFLSFVFRSEIYAKESFELTPDFVSSNLDNVVEIKLPALMENYYVRPVVDAGSVLVWDDSGNFWKSGDVSWSDLPIVTSNLKLKIITSSAEAKLSLLLQDKSSFVLHRTNDINVFTSSSRDDYTALLNTNINNWSYQEIPQVLISSNEPPSANNFGIEKLKNLIFVFVGALFAIKYIGNPFKKSAEIEL